MSKQLPFLATIVALTNGELVDDTFSIGDIPKKHYVYLTKIAGVRIARAYMFDKDKRYRLMNPYNRISALSSYRQRIMLVHCSAGHGQQESYWSIWTGLTKGKLAQKIDEISKNDFEFLLSSTQEIVGTDSANEVPPSSDTPSDESRPDEAETPQDEPTPFEEPDSLGTDDTENVQEIPQTVSTKARSSKTLE